MNGNGNGQKQSQQEAGYGRGTPTKHCGLCRYYDSRDSECLKVEGKISPFGLSNVYDPRPNPFGSKLGPKETAMIDAMMTSGPDESDAIAPVAPTTRIGSKTYG